MCSSGSSEMCAREMIALCAVRLFLSILPRSLILSLSLFLSSEGGWFVRSTSRATRQHGTSEMVRVYNLTSVLGAAV